MIPRRLYDRRRYAVLKELGRCTWHGCKKKAAPGRTLCPAHLLLNRRKRSLYYNILHR